ncbi:MAG TPA: hypothetical protein ENI69_06055, partial [Rhodospirillales bacterium]|nr:hypothetical protein [Rhodospirillales bacterium]
MKKLVVFAVLLLAACAGPPRVTPSAGKGAIVGIVTARPHAELIEKFNNQDNDVADGYGSTAEGEMVFSKSMVNYPQIDDIYVGLTGNRPVAPATHDLVATEGGLSPQGIALALGDTVHIRNATSQSLTFFVTNEETDEFDEIDPIAPGQSGDLTITMEGTLDLGVDERDDLKAALLSKAGMATKRLKSGAGYAFNNLEPGTY